MNGALDIETSNFLRWIAAMRFSQVLLHLMVLFAFVPTPASAQFTVREAGFVEIEPRPFRLLHLTDTENTPATLAQHTKLLSQTRHSNIVLVHLPTDPKKVAAVLKSIPLPTDLKQSEFWLIAPDDRMIPFDPFGTLIALLRSPIRNEIRGEIAKSLCTVLLLESTDEFANRRVDAKVKRVLGAFNKDRSKLDESLHHDVRLITLSNKRREQERWTLWGLGEELASTETPKIVVLFGNMLRAGEAFKGAEWADKDLLERIATLTMPCENDPNQRKLFGHALPFGIEKDWLGDMKDTLKFDPQSKDARLKLADLWTKAGPKIDDKAPRRMAFTKLLDGFHELDPEHGGDPQHDPNRPDNDFFPVRPIVEPAEPAKSFFASTALGIILFVAGLAGWVALAATTWMVERSRASTTTRPKPGV